MKFLCCRVPHLRTDSFDQETHTKYLNKGQKGTCNLDGATGFRTEFIQGLCGSGGVALCGASAFPLILPHAHTAF